MQFSTLEIDSLINYKDSIERFVNKLKSNKEIITKNKAMNIISIVLEKENNQIRIRKYLHKGIKRY